MLSLTDEGVYVREIALPLHIKGVTIPNEDGTFDIYINAVLPDFCKHLTLQHELKHINLDHFYKPCECIAAEEQAANM